MEIEYLINGLYIIALGGFGWFLKNLHAEVKGAYQKFENLPEKYVPRKEMHERQLKLEVIIDNMNVSTQEIKSNQKEHQKKIEESLVRIHERLDSFKC